MINSFTNVDPEKENSPAYLIEFLFILPITCRGFNGRLRKTLEERTSQN